VTDCKLRPPLSVILLLLLPVFAFAQTKVDIDNAKPWQLKSYAKKAQAVGDVYSAIDYYELYLKKRKDNTQIAFRLAELYERSRNYTMAAHWYQMVFESDPEKEPIAQFNLARMQQQLGQYEAANKNLQEFLKAAKSLKEAKYYKKLAKIHIEGCNQAPALLDSLLDVKIIHLDNSINKAHVEQNPISLDDNTMLYVSLKADSIVKYDLHGDRTERPVRRFYQAQKNDGHWQSTGPWEGPTFDPVANIANGAFSPDRTRFYYTQCETSFTGKNHCTIWSSKKEGNQWQPGEQILTDINSAKFSSTQPAVGTESKRNREVLYFVSDRPGGRGGKDIWYAIYDPKAGTFKEAKNAGSKINSIADEMTPYYDNATKTLYFSSSGWPGQGGLDIFKSTGELKKFGLPVNIGVPFNSSADDLYYNLESNREEGFFVSNREGGVALKNPTCCDDIYFFSWTDFVRLALEGTVLANDPKNPSETVDGAIVTLLVKDQTSGDFLTVNRDTTQEDGYYFFEIEPGPEYKVNIEKPGFFSTAERVNTAHVTASDTLAIKTKRMEIMEEEKAMELQNIFFDFNSSELNATTKAILDTTLLVVMQENPELKIEVGSHTDTKGSAEYNQKLSGKRANAVVAYLLNKGIERKRIVSKGYGESQPKVQDENPDGTYNEEAMQQNRRTEFKVVGRIAIKTEEDED